MEFLSWLFFCLSPFALFCSEDGNGLILCPIFIVLGFVFKCAGSNISGTPTVRVKVNPQDFWEWHYKDRMRNTLAQKDTISDGLMALEDKEARSWATTICGYHNAPVPSEGRQEEIARSNGVITEKMAKERAAKKDRIQIGKYFLLKELEEKYYGKRFGKNGRGERHCYPWIKIKDDRYKIRLSNGHLIGNTLIEFDYKMSLRAIWDSLSIQEKEQATKWIKEYEEKLLEQIRFYIEDGRDFRSVGVEF